MRGKVADVERWTLNRRITPAYAGKSSHRTGGRSDRRDHPRLCGEKLWHHRGIRQQEGITPAYAGKRVI